jgi:hypothetical protein
MAGDRIDIVQQFVDLASQEDTLAAFDFTVQSAAGTPVSGLCRVSKPRGRVGGLAYLSLVFVADAADDATRAAVDAALTELESPPVRAALPMVQDVVALPAMTEGGESYVRQIDLLFQAHVDPGTAFVRDRLLPTLQRHVELTVGDVIWWGDTEAPMATAAQSESLLDWLRSNVWKKGGAA